MPAQLYGRIEAEFVGLKESTLRGRLAALGA